MHLEGEGFYEYRVGYRGNGGRRNFWVVLEELVDEVFEFFFLHIIGVDFQQVV